MNSPVFAHLKSLIQIDRRSVSAVYLQIAGQLSIAIQRGFLMPGMKLPGSRQLSEMLDVHRNTIVAAYSELDAQGWVEVKANQGTFVIRKSDFKPVKIQFPEAIKPERYKEGAGFNFEKTNLLDFENESAEQMYVANDGLPDIRLSQIQQLTKWYSAGLKRNSRPYALNQEGNDFFKEQLSNYLNLSRGLHVSKNQILVTRSVEMSIFLASEILIQPGDQVIVGNLSYYVPNMIFQKAGATICSVRMDSDGIDVEQVKQLCEKKKIRLLYLTPHQHYPTTVTLSAEKRMQLLQLAEQYGFIILEDDYDYDFNYQNNRILPIASADRSNMVVYIGAFGNTLAPGFRRGFVIGPKDFVKELNNLQRIVDRQADVFMEYVLAELIDEGEIHRFSKKNIKIYKERRDYFAYLLAKELGNIVDFDIPSGGLAYWIKWNKDINLLKLSKNAADKGLFIPKTLLYQSLEVSAIRFGFGHFNKEEQEQVVKILKNSIPLIDGGLLS